VQYGDKKFVSIKDEDPYTVELARALELIKAKEEFDANRTILDFPEAGIQVLNGRFGPYITDRVKNAKIPKGRDPKTLTLDECKELIATAPVRPKGGRFGQKTAAKKTVAAPAPIAAKPLKAAAKNAKPAKKAASKESGGTKAPSKAKSSPKQKTADKTADK
jgi:DNA topoisomerase-1